MKAARRLRTLMHWGMLLLSFACVSGCQTPRGTDPAVMPHSAYRPAFSNGDPRRTLFLGGYAGFNYGPVGTSTEMATRSGGEAWAYPAARPPFSGWFGR